MRTAGFRFIIFFLVLPALLHAPLALAGEHKRNLAVVVESSAAMEESWPGGNRRASLNKALSIELAALPLSARAGLWASSTGQAQKVVSPVSADRLRGLKLRLIRGKGRADLKPGLIEAFKWLAKAGGGSVLLICRSAPAGFNPKEFAAMAPADSFIQILCLGPPTDALKSLALAAGGAVFAVTGPKRLMPALRQAVELSLSPASLLVETRNHKNTPREVFFGLLRNRSLAVYHRAKGFSPVQVLPGVMGLSWPKDNGLGPGPAPGRVQIKKTGRTVLFAGGKGELNLKSQGARPMDLKITRLGGVTMEPVNRAAPVKLTLPAGDYLVDAKEPALRWRVRVRPGGVTELLVGPAARLTLMQKGPYGDLRRLVKAVLAPHGIKPSLGHTGQTLLLPPGAYQIWGGAAPGSRLRLNLKPGQNKTAWLPPAGGVAISGRPRPGDILRISGGGLARPLELNPKRPVFLMPGTYRVSNKASRLALTVKVSPERITTIDIGALH